MELCIYLTWDWSIVLTIVNILVTIIIPLYIYHNWNNQKKREVIAEVSASLAKELRIYLDDVWQIQTYFNPENKSKNVLHTSRLSDSRDIITVEIENIIKELKKISFTDNGLEQTLNFYMDSSDKFIHSLLNPNESSDIFLNQIASIKQLISKINDMKFFNF